MCWVAEIERSELSAWGVLYIKAIQFIFSWDCIMFQGTEYPLF